MEFHAVVGTSGFLNFFFLLVCKVCMYTHELLFWMRTGAGQFCLNPICASGIGLNSIDFKFQILL